MATPRNSFPTNTPTMLPALNAGSATEIYPNDQAHIELKIVGILAQLGGAVWGALAVARSPVPSNRRRSNPAICPVILYVRFIFAHF